MSNGITLSAGVRANLLSLQNTAQLMQTTQNRLATGKKVNSALDNPISFFTSQSLQSRAGDLNSLLDSMSNGIQTIQAANNGLTSITSTVQSMQSTLNQALQDSSWQSASYTIDSTTIGTTSAKNLTFSGGAVSGTVNVAVNSTTTVGTQSTLSTSSAYLAPSVADPAATESGTYDGLSGAATYSFKVNGQDITLDSSTTGTTSGDTLAHAKVSIQAQLDARFGSGSFTVGANTAGDGFKITGKADGTNDVSISNQAGTGAVAHQASVVGGAFTALTGADTYSFDFNDGTSTTAITLTTAQGASAATARAAIQSQLDTAYGTGSFTVSGTTGITITGKADGSNSVSISNQAAPVNAGGATAAGIGLGTTLNADAGTLNQTVTGLGLGSTTSTSYGTPADPYDFTVNGTSVSVTAGTGLAAAVTSINSQLSAANSKFEAFDNSGSLGIREIAAGGTALTIGGTDATSLFGGTLTNTGTAAGTAAVQTVDQLVSSINSNTSLAGKVKASNDNGSLRITNLSLSDLTVVGASSSAVNGGTGGSNTQTIGGNSVRKGLVQQFNTLRDQLDKYAGDASYNGINLLSGDNLKLTLNETGSSAINIQAKDANGNVLSINSTNLSISQAQNSDFDSNTSINNVLGTLTSALSTLRSQGSAFGSNLSTVQNRQDFTKAMINTLQTGADNLVLADTNQEGANMLALQTRQSLSTTALSLSAQADQAVLSLFQ
ncbi:MAG: flagellin [Pseudolabrys sp.]|jgi:flagellin-like hook-associated protein FlgL